MTIKNLLKHISLVLLSILSTHAYSFEITPLTGYRLGNTLAVTNAGESIKVEENGSYGLILGFNRSATSKIELLYSHQNTALRTTLPSPASLDLTLEYFQLGGTTIYQHNNLRPFVSGGLGFTRISPKNNISPETRFSLSIGGGVNIPLAERIDLRLEGRVYGTLVDSEYLIICGGGCVAKFSGSFYTQFEAMAGLTFSF